jgi:hypothetical protein
MLKKDFTIRLGCLQYLIKDKKCTRKQIKVGEINKSFHRSIFILHDYKNNFFSLFVDICIKGFCWIIFYLSLNVYCLYVWGEENFLERKIYKEMRLWKKFSLHTILSSELQLFIFMYIQKELLWVIFKLCKRGFIAESLKIVLKFQERVWELVL